MNDLIVSRAPTAQGGLTTPPAPPDRGRLLCEITKRQLECLAWVEEGKSASDIGGILGISQRTVEGHLLKICSHLGVKTRVQALLRARDLGLIDPRRKFTRP
ncbi:helix-turn-helix transcriptional regulator [Phenylobacterium sp.]|uniref:helix-turn-helix transcriptional regulator n=1 Tax=Phenylobacterium sp. TaxID=1871053 RepID=UPI002896D48C|nr:helix-turn-helix transcriptional regulator [Phenylobacterium sp.]